MGIPTVIVALPKRNWKVRLKEEWRAITGHRVQPKRPRHTMEEVLRNGYLSEAEAAYQRREVEDYYLFPAGRLRQGKAQLKHCVRGHLWPTSIRGMFHQLEEAAGVEHQHGRAFYGLRRQATDPAPEFVQDARVLNRLTGHLDSATRERVYRDPENERVRAAAADARQRMRQHLRVVSGNGSRKAA